MEFFYKGISTDGNTIKGSIEAANIDEAKKKLKAQNILFSELSERSQGLLETLSLFRRDTLSSGALSQLSRDLAVYLNAGVPLVRSLTLLRHQSRSDSRMERFYDTLIEHIHEGKSFAQSLDMQEFYTLPVFYVGTLKISEDRGILAQVLNELSHYLNMQEKIKKQLSQAMVYPSFIIVVAVLMISFMLTVVVPKITSVFESTGQPLPMLTQWVISSAHFFAEYWIVLFAGLLAAISLFVFKMATDSRFKRLIHGIVLKLPIVGKMVETADLARFCTISSLLIRSGVPVVNTMKLSSITLSSAVIKELFEQASTKVVEGSSLSNALRQSDVYSIDASFVEAVAIGEETSEVSTMLEHLSTLYIDSNKDRISIFLAVLEPALMLLIGGMIGVIVTAMLLPIFSLNLE